MAILNHGALINLWEDEGGPGFVADTAAAIAQAESGGDTTRINNTAYPNRPGYHPPRPGDLKEYSVGLWQINMLAHPSYTEAFLLTPQGNASAAIAISQHGLDFRQWTTYRDETYKKFLVQVPAPPPETTGVPGVGGTPGLVSMGGWHEFNNSLAAYLPWALHQSQKARLAALRVLR